MQETSASNYEELDEASDVVELSCMIKDVAFDLNDKKYPPMQAATAWKNLCLVKQKDNEELLDCHKRFVALLEIVECLALRISSFCILMR